MSETMSGILAGWQAEYRKQSPMIRYTSVYATVKTATDETYREIADSIFIHGNWRITDIEDDEADGTTVLRIEGEYHYVVVANAACNHLILGYQIL